jgi:hypothetical protein
MKWLVIALSHATRRSSEKGISPTVCGSGASQELWRLSGQGRAPVEWAEPSQMINILLN